MSEPSTNNLQKMGITNVGLPSAEWHAGKNFFVDLNVVDSNALAEVLGISPELKSFKEIVTAIQSLEGGADKIDKLVKTAQTMKYPQLQALRITRHEAMAFSQYYGKNDVSPLLTVGDIGHATVITIQKESHELTAAQSLLRGLQKFLEARGKSKKLRALLVIDGGEEIVPRIDAPITKALVQTIRDLMEYGVGFVVDAPTEADVHEAFINGAEANVRTIADDEVGVRLLTKRPYRIKLRPLASKISV